MEPFCISHRNSSIVYYRHGTGPEIAICFHGYGEEATVFSFLAKQAGNQYTFYSIDLPFHGKTEWNEGLEFSQNDLLQIVESIIATNYYKLNTSKITLIGFSLGGRMVLNLYELIPEKIKRIVLLAPDGLKVNFWYWLSTQTWIGNKLFAFTMNNPGWFFSFLKLLNKLHLVNTSIFKFVKFYIGNNEVRQLLYKRWTSLRNIKPHIHKIKSLIKRENTSIRLIYGKHDRIILSSVGKKFRKRIEDQCTLSVINSGHQVLHEKHIQEIIPALLH